MKHLCSLVLILCLFANSAIGAAVESPANPYLSGALNAVIPGSGYWYNGDSTKAALGFTTTVGMMYPLFARSPTNNAGRTGSTLSFLLARNVYGYTVYDSFQDALTQNGRPKLLVNNEHYSMGQMLAAPFRPSLYAPKKVWIPLAILGGILALGVAGARANGQGSPLKAEKLAWGIPLIAASTAVIGAGEEAEFRGYYYPAFSELTGSVYAGAVLQAGLFGFQHTAYPGTGFPTGSGAVVHAIKGDYQRPELEGKDLTKFLFTFLGGLQHAWVTSEDGLLNSTAMHAAWDFMILTALLVKDNEAPPLVFSLTF